MVLLAVLVNFFGRWISRGLLMYLVLPSIVRFLLASRDEVINVFHFFYNILLLLPLISTISTYMKLLAHHENNLTSTAVDAP